MISTRDTIYIAKDGKRFLNEKECAKYEREKFPTRRYVVTLQASFTVAYEVECITQEEAIEKARTDFFYDYDNGTDYDVEAYEVQCDDDEEED